jgi:hypothetical protein
MSTHNEVPHLLYLFHNNKDAVGTISSELPNKEQKRGFAESFCGSVLRVLWERRVSALNHKLEIPEFEGKVKLPDEKTRQLAMDTGFILSKFDNPISGYLVGGLYTSLLPPDLRSEWGVYYTPPPLVGRLVSTVTQGGFDWKTSKIIDPACGGAAFLAPLADQICQTILKKGVKHADMVLDIIARNLSGVEIDPFAAWMSQVLTEIRVLKLEVLCNRRLPKIIHVGNALEYLLENERQYDLVIGNPPYGKINLPEKTRRVYQRSLYGHANLYGLFTDLALRISKPDAVIAYVTPTSFLAGQYFKLLRKLLADEAPPAVVDFVNQRDGVFEDVLQETVLVVFKKKRRKPETAINVINANKTGGISVNRISRCVIDGASDMPWLFPRTKTQQALLDRAVRMSNRLPKCGFTVCTGQLVWNRHKNQLRGLPNGKTAPLIWAESVLPDGTFRFKSVRPNHKPFFELLPNQEYLVTKQECVLVQRTTAKEQHRRLISAVMPKAFLDHYGGWTVIENHLNIVKPTEDTRVSLEVISALLNSHTVDQVFRCMSGSVAVSAYELNALPLPDIQDLDALGDLIKSSRGKDEIETFIGRLYGEA